MGILESSHCDWNVCVNIEAIVYKLVVGYHIGNVRQFQVRSWLSGLDSFTCEEK